MLANGNNNGTKLYFCSYFGILQCLFLRLPSPLTRTIDRRHVWKFSRVTISRAGTDVASVCMPIQSSVLYSFRSSAESKLRPISLVTVSSSHASSIDSFIGSWIFSQRSRWPGGKRSIVRSKEISQRLHSMIGPTLLATAIWRRDERKWHVETETRGSNRGNTNGLVFVLFLN